jgi:predicted transcriptional regulator
MELNLNPATEAKLNELAQRTGRGADELIDEAVDHLIAYDEWLGRKMRPRIEALERGEPAISDEEVRAWLGRQQERERQEQS